MKSDRANMRKKDSSEAQVRSDPSVQDHRPWTGGFGFEILYLWREIWTIDVQWDQYGGMHAIVSSFLVLHYKVGLPTRDWTSCQWLRCSLGSARCISPRAPFNSQPVGQKSVPPASVHIYGGLALRGEKKKNKKLVRTQESCDGHFLRYWLRLPRTVQKPLYDT